MQACKHESMKACKHKMGTTHPGQVQATLEHWRRRRKRVGRRARACEHDEHERKMSADHSPKGCLREFKSKAALGA